MRLFFQIKALCQQHKVQVFSSNHTLYGDLSQRVMMTIEEEWPHLEIYSIDEAFLDLSTLPESQLEDWYSHIDWNWNNQNPGKGCQLSM